MLPSFIRSFLPSHRSDDERSRSPPRRLLLSSSPPPPPSSPSSKELPLAPHPPPASAHDPLPPYLTSRPLLALTLLSPPVLALLLALFTLTLLATQATVSVAAAKREILAGCTAAEQASRALEHVPAIMKEQSERALAKAVEAAVHGVGTVLMLAITVIQEVLKFLIDTFRSMYLCCLELVIFGALAILIGAVEEISDAITATLSGIRTLIQSQVSTANSVVQTAVNAINDVTSVFGISAMTIDEFSIPALTQLENVTVRSVLEDELRKLNSSLPTLDEVRDKLDSFIDEPFDLMITKINSTTSNFTFTPSASPASNETSTALAAASSTTANDSLCAGLDLSFVDEIGDELQKIKSWGIGLLVVAILIAIAVLLYLETLRYRSLVERVRLYPAVRADKAAGALGEHELMEIVELGQMNVFGVWAWRALEGWKRLGEGSTRRGKWLVSLIFHPLALAPLLIGSIGLVTIWFQLAAVNALEAKANALSSSSADAMSTSMTAALNDRLALAGQEWAADVNRQIAETQAMLDDDLFGEWLNTTTVVLNTTIVEFYALVTEAVNVTFGSTILEAPISTFLYCVVGSKVAALETALTWIHDNAHFTLPTVDSDVFAILNTTTIALVAPIAAAAVGTGDNDDDDGGVLQRLIEHYKTGLRNAQIVHAIFVGLWALVVVGGIVAVVLDAQRERHAREGREAPDLRAIVGSWPVFKVLGRQRRRQRGERYGDGSDVYENGGARGWSNESEADGHQQPEMAEKVRSLAEAFGPGRALPPTPLSPSHHHLTANTPAAAVAFPPSTPAPPKPATHAPADQTHSYFEFDGGVDQASPYPWPLRSTALQPDGAGGARGVEMGASAGWKIKLRGRMAALATGLQGATSGGGGLALADDSHPSAAAYTTDRRSLVINPFTDDSHLPIVQAHSQLIYRPAGAPDHVGQLPSPPGRYTADPSPYHTIGSPRDRFMQTPIFAQHQRAAAAPDPFADGQRTGEAIGHDPRRNPFDDGRP